MVYDVAIIGGGPGGYTAAEKAAKSGLKTILFEKKGLGGICLNEGCVPTKTILYSAKVLQTVRESSKYGIICDNISVDLHKIISRKNKIIRKLSAGIRMRLQESGVEIVVGEAFILPSENEYISIKCEDTAFSCKNLLICTGSEGVIPPIQGLADADYLTSTTALDLKELPVSLCIIGGGVIGMEFASIFNTMGVEVAVVEMQDEILGGMDKEIASMLRNEYAKRGVDFHLSAKVIAIEGRKINIEKEGESFQLTPDKILLSVGRKPLISGSGLENLSLEKYRNGLKVNQFMQTSRENVYACGDVTGFSMLAHTAVREAEIAVDHILKKLDNRMEYRSIPAVVYTNPEVAGVGYTEEQLIIENIPYVVKKLPMSFSGRFVAENEQGTGLCKILLSKENTVLGVHMLGNPASEIIITAEIAVSQRMNRKQLESMIFPHPTVGEIIRETLF